MAEKAKKAEAEEIEEAVEDTAEETTEEEKEEIKEETDGFKDKYIRLMADFDNFKKRTQKEVTSTYTNAVTDTVEKLLPVMDNFERAMASADENDEFAKGISMIYKQLKDVFETIGIKEIEALGKTFDPNLHNAVMHVDDEEKGENEIIEEFMKGYTLKDKVIRHSVVKVAN